MANQSFNDIENEILGIIYNAWRAENEHFTIENDELETGGEPWIRCAFNYSTNEVAGLGKKVTKRRTGICITQIFVEANTGTAEANRLIQLIVDAFESPSLSTRIKFFDIVPNRIGLSGKWLQNNLSVAFRWDVQK